MFLCKDLKSIFVIFGAKHGRSFGRVCHMSHYLHFHFSPMLGFINIINLILAVY
jgi:hypothetical protein